VYQAKGDFMLMLSSSHKRSNYRTETTQNVRFISLGCKRCSGMVHAACGMSVRSKFVFESLVHAHLGLKELPKRAGN
jgi:hypothetical protein